MKVLGVDPGVSGALAIYDDSRPDYVFPIDVPTVPGKTRGRDVDWPALADEINITLGGADHAYIEQVNAGPGEGRATIFKFGYAAGGQRGIIVGSNIPVTMVLPQKWKREMRVTREKETSLALARTLFPEAVDFFKRKKDHNRSEAALIAYYGYCKLTGKDLPQ